MASLDKILELDSAPELPDISGFDPIDLDQLSGVTNIDGGLTWDSGVLTQSFDAMNAQFKALSSFTWQNALLMTSGSSYTWTPYTVSDI